MASMSPDIICCNGVNPMKYLYIYIHIHCNNKIQQHTITYCKVSEVSVKHNVVSVIIEWVTVKYDKIQQTTVSKMLKCNIVQRNIGYLYIYTIYYIINRVCVR